MINPQDWDEDYILNSLPKNENDRVEFKGRRVVDLTVDGNSNIDRKNLGKELAAFANSGGGVLVLGINNETKQIDDGGIHVKVRPNGTREWLDDILPQLTDPPLQKLNVYEILRRDVTSALQENRALYVVEVGDSPIAPHQSASDRIYYGRVSSKSQPLGDRMVRDIMNRRQFPDLNVSFFFAHVDDKNPDLFVRNGQHTVLCIQVMNSGPVYAQFVNSILLFPAFLIPPGAAKNFLKGEPVELADGVKYFRIVRENVAVEEFETNGTLVGRGPGRFIPVLPGMTHSWKIPLIDDFETRQMLFGPSGPQLLWELYADNAPLKKGEIKLIEINFKRDFMDPNFFKV